MSHYRKQVTRVDAAQQDIVDGLRAAGVIVEIIGQPVDLACRKPTWQPGVFLLMEVKTPLSKTGRTYSSSPAQAKRMKKQADFCAANGVPIVTSFNEALARIQQT